MAKDETSMTSGETKVPVGKGEKSGTPSTAMQMWRPFENLRHEVDRLFDDFYTRLPFRPPFRRPAFDIEPFWAPRSWVTVPAVDFVEHDDAFEMTADLPGLDEKNIELKVGDCPATQFKSTPPIFPRKPNQSADLQDTTLQLTGRQWPTGLACRNCLRIMKAPFSLEPGPCLGCWYMQEKNRTFSISTLTRGCASEPICLRAPAGSTTAAHSLPMTANTCSSGADEMRKMPE